MNTGLATRCRKLFVVAAIPLFIYACLPDESLSELDSLAPSPRISLPLLTSNVSLSEVLNMEEGGILQENEDNTYSIFYNTHFASEPLSNYFQGIPDQYYDKSFSFVTAAPSFSLISPPVTFNETIPFDFIGQQPTKIGCKSGILNISLNSNYQHQVEATLSFPDILLPTGEALVMSFFLNDSGYAYENQSIDLTEYIINPDNNEVSYSLALQISGSGAATYETDRIVLEFNINDLDFSYMEGSFEEFQIPIEPGVLEIPFLSNVASGNIALQPKITLNFTNSFGVPSVADFSNIIVENKEGIIKLQDEGEGNFFHNNYPFPYPDNRTDLPAILSYEVNGQNSNINQAFASIPKQISYALGFTAGSQPGGTDFITDTSMVNVDVEMEIPLAGNFDLLLTDTLAIDFGDLEDVQELKMLIRTENAFPVTANLQVFFLDENRQIIIDSNREPVKLFSATETLLEAATITNPATGETTPSITNPLIAGVINGEQFDLIQNAGYLLIVAQLNSVSENNGAVKLYSFYDLQIDIAMQAKASFNF
jgi:hypothetical protein